MGRSAELTLGWADGDYLFALKWGQLVELQEKTDAGPYFLLSRLHDGNWRVGDIREVIRLGLIGGGMEPINALGMVKRYVEDRPPMENLATAQAILGIAIMGAPEEKVGKADAGAEVPKRRSRAAKSASPASTEQGRP